MRDLEAWVFDGGAGRDDLSEGSITAARFDPSTTVLGIEDALSPFDPSPVSVDLPTASRSS